MLGSTLVTIQTGPEGKTVNRLYVEQGIDIARELYLAILLDRSRSRRVHSARYAPAYRTPSTSGTSCA